MFQYLQAPEVNIDTFKVDPLEFLYFIASFEEVVERKIKDQKGCLTRLLKYLAEELKDLVSSCIYLPTTECHKEANCLLKQRYGDPYRIVSEYRKSLKQWPKLKANDSSGFRRFRRTQKLFSCFIQNYLYTYRTDGTGNH